MISFALRTPAKAGIQNLAHGWTPAFAGVLGALLALPTPALAEKPGEIARFDWFEYRGEAPGQKLGPDQYRNPILAGFYPDPSIVRVGEDYYLINSTFAYFPGIPIFHSRDLVSWTQIGNAIDRPKQMPFGNAGLSRAIFAPAISWHDGVFHIVSTCIECGGNFVITARDPKGPWSDPIWLDFEGIDPSLFFDADGSAWVVNNGAPQGTPRYDGHRAIWIQRYDTAVRKMVGPRKLLLDGGVRPEDKPIWIEGPHVFRKDGFYYLIAAEGGTAENHSQVVLRSRRVDGPYVPAPGNPILTQRGLDRARPHPITSAGHADLVETQTGEWWSVFLATRPYRDDHYNIGRETFLMPVRWKDGWPEVTAPGEVIPSVAQRPDLPRQPVPPVPTNGSFTLRDEFDAPRLAPSWLRIRTPVADWHDLSSEPGTLIVDARREPLGGKGQPAYLGRRLQHHRASATTSLRYRPAAAGDRAGLAVLQNESHFYALSLRNDGKQTLVALERRAADSEPADGATIASVPIAPTAGQPIELRIEAENDHYRFSYALQPGEWRVLAADVDGTLLSTKTAGGFIGATIGLFARKGDAAQ